MTATQDPKTDAPADEPAPRRGSRRKALIALWVGGVAVVLVLGAAAWLFARIATVRAEVATLPTLVADLRTSAAAADTAAMTAAVSEIAEHTTAARDASADPLWRIAENLPWAGENLRAVREAAVIADDLVNAVGMPLVDVVASTNPETLFASDGSVALPVLQTLATSVATAKTDLVPIGAAAASLQDADVVPDVRQAVDSVTGIVTEATGIVDSVDQAASLGVSMLGGDRPRNYLVLIMNNAELRAQGGMPGFTAALTATNGRIELVRTASTVDFEPVAAAPLLATQPWEDALYTSDVARRIQDTTATHDFRDSARYAKALAEPVYGMTFDGVAGIDPYVLSYFLAALGPVTLETGETLEAGNAVNTLLRDAYIRFPQPSQQDLFFESTVDTLMADVTAGSFDRAAFLSAIARSVQEERVRLWSTEESEQLTIESTALSGHIPDAADGPVIGVYANDWTRSKMDFYLDPRADVVDLGCADGRRQASVTVSLTHTLTAEQAAALPDYVTGDGNRVARGDIATQIVVVGPAGATVDESTGADADLMVATVTDDAGRPAATRTMVVAPGQTATTTVRVSWPAGDAAPLQIMHTPQIAIGDTGVSADCG